MSLNENQPKQSKSPLHEA